MIDATIIHPITEPAVKSLLEINEILMTLSIKEEEPDMKLFGRMAFLLVEVHRGIRDIFPEVLVESFQETLNSPPKDDGPVPPVITMHREIMSGIRALHHVIQRAEERFVEQKKAEET